jgi:hypothetical protein
MFGVQRLRQNLRPLPVRRYRGRSAFARRGERSRLQMKTKEALLKLATCAVAGVLLPFVIADDVYHYLRGGDSLLGREIAEQKRLRGLK